MAATPASPAGRAYLVKFQRRRTPVYVRASDKTQAVALARDGFRPDSLGRLCEIIPV